MILSGTADVLGFCGAVMVLSGFAYQTLRNAAPSRLSNGVNLIGASLLALSLIVNYNLPALLLEIAWAGIAFFGLVRTVVIRR
ncbi:CBU_0592 family membrane protein [Sphingomonas psychrolutea]|uniref:CBU-0592-like domain-containing protein n=1 Tax=Sphingomonas psychrolutea TaxID=1259676 RepID=A0ABQ1GUE1_9SPHN|nr:hypothetical protein [Sphingomonas psychrolutea]GGA50603.1 hypothetical protein GCM10011395_21230 [Sphingomonas psychrolutea]